MGTLAGFGKAIVESVGLRDIETLPDVRKHRVALLEPNMAGIYFVPQDPDGLRVAQELIAEIEQKTPGDVFADYVRWQVETSDRSLAVCSTDAARWEYTAWGLWAAAGISITVLPDCTGLGPDEFPIADAAIQATALVVIASRDHDAETVERVCGLAQRCRSVCLISCPPHAFRAWHDLARRLRSGLGIVALSDDGEAPADRVLQ